MFEFWPYCALFGLGRSRDQGGSLDPFHPQCTCPEVGGPKSDHFGAIFGTTHVTIFWGPALARQPTKGPLLIRGVTHATHKTTSDMPQESSKDSQEKPHQHQRSLSELGLRATGLLIPKKEKLSQSQGKTSCEKKAE